MGKKRGSLGLESAGGFEVLKESPKWFPKKEQKTPNIYRQQM